MQIMRPRVGGASAALLLFLLAASTGFFPAVEVAGMRIRTLANPVAKVLELLNRLQQDVIADGQKAQGAYEEKADWCSQQATQKQDEIKTAQDTLDDMSSTIVKAESQLKELATRIEELSGSIATDEKDLEAATIIREKDKTTFEQTQQQLTTDIDMLGRAQKVLKEELSKGASLAQLNQAALASNPLDGPAPLVGALGKLLEAISMPLDDKGRLTELVSLKESEDAASALAGPEEDGPYKSKAGGILDVLADMQDKAQKTLDEKQREEMQSQHNFQMLKMSLEDSIKADKAELDDAKKSQAEKEEVKAQNVGESQITKKSLAEDQTTLKDVQSDCMTAAATFEAETSERSKELLALATAKKIIQESTQFVQTDSSSGRSSSSNSGEQEEQQYVGQEEVSLVQLGSSTRSRRGRSAALEELAIPVRFQALKVVKALALRDKSPQLLQLVRKMSDALQFGSVVSSTGGQDPFVKVRKMLEEMIEKLMAEASEAAQKKEFCDREMSQTTNAQHKKGVKIEDLSTKLDKANAKIQEIKGDISDLSKEILEISKSQQEMDKMRAEEKAKYEAAKADLEKGLNGVETAQKVLRDYYGKGDSFLETGSSTDLYADMKEQVSSTAPKSAADSILELLKVAAGDFSKNLADLQAEEDTAVEEYEKLTQENKVATAAKSQEEKFKKKEKIDLEKFVQETEGDKASTQSELDAVNEYYGELKPKCVAEPEPFEERQKRREQEMEGLKTAMRILSGTMLLQEAGAGNLPARSFRGVAAPHNPF